MKTKIKIDNGAFMPKKAHPGDAGYDVRVPYTREPITVLPQNFAFIDSGIAIQGEERFHIDVRSRSGLAVNHQVFSFLGLIDSPYTGNIGILVGNFGKEPYTINPGDKICQLVKIAQEDMDFEPVDCLGETDRGENGFGSTGK